MKRIAIYIVVLAALLLAPINGMDIERLKPVELVFVYEDENKIVIETDTGDKGVGEDAKVALQNLKDTTDGYIYIDTAQYLLMTEKTQDAVETLRPVLKKSLQLCLAQKDVDLAAAARFLPAHGKFLRLKEWKTGETLKKLVCIEERLKLS